MNALRRFILGHHRFAAGLLALALCVRLLVPGGYMPVVAGGSMMVSICSASGATAMVAMPGMTHHERDGSADHGKAQMPCAFSGLGFVSLAATDAILLAAAIAYAEMAGRAAIRWAPLTARAHLRPPLRGPPAAA